MNLLNIDQTERPGTNSCRQTIKEFMAQFRPQGLQNIVAILPDGAPTGATFEMPRQINEATEWAAEQNQAGKNVYFTVNPVKSAIHKKPKKSDIECAEYTHVDIDPDIREGYAEGRSRLLEKTLSALEDFAPAPAFVIDSGNGFAAFWRLQGATVDEAEEINKRLIERFGGDIGTHNLDRVMRLPGTLNYPTRTKLAKGYPENASLSSLLVCNPDACSVDQLEAVLPTLKNTSVSAAQQAPSTSPSSLESKTPLSPNDIEAVNSKLRDALEQSSSLRKRWHGDADGLTDTSRSGWDFSITAMLKANGFSYPETAYLVTHEFAHGKRTENSERDLERNWVRCGTDAPDEIVTLCVEAKGRGEPWESRLYAAHPNAQTVDSVLEQLGHRTEFAGKRALKADYDAFVATMAITETEQEVLAQAGERLALLWVPTQLNEMVEQTEKALISYPGKWEVLLYGGIHSRVAMKAPEHLHMIDDASVSAPRVPVFDPYSQQGMLLRIEQSVAFYEKKEGRAVLKPVPENLPNLILKKPDPTLPVTVGLVAHPLVLPNGEVLIEEGLDEQSGIYAHFGGASFEAPGAMSPEEAVAILRTEMLGEFDFAAETDAAAAVALVLTAIERKTLDMAPGFMINASTQGSGKTTLARMAHLLVTGHDMPVAAMSENVEEQNKELTAMLMASVPIVCFDNVPDAFKVSSPVLARALTSPTHTGRILGLSKMAELPTNTVFVVTGNNISADIDLSRRLLEVRLAPKEARPEQRQFTNPDVVGYVLRNRTRWMQASLAILSGRREPKEAAPPSGFHQWDRMIRWPLVNAGVADPVIKFDEVRERSPDYERMAVWMLGLAHGFDIGKPFRAQDLIKPDRSFPTPWITSPQIDDNVRRAEMYSEYLDGHPPPKGWNSVHSIGWMLNRLVGRSIEGYKLTTKKVKGTTRYTVEAS